VRVIDGKISSEIVAVPTDEGKAEALRQAGLPAPDAVFGNSIHDLAMLEIARCAFPVNPSPALKLAAAQHGWGYFQPLAAEGIDAQVSGE
jgi:phosphoserine phosphatase